MAGTRCAGMLEGCRGAVCCSTGRQMLRHVKQSRRRFLTTALIGLAAAPIGLLGCSDAPDSTTRAADPPSNKDDRAMQQITPVAISLPMEGDLPSLGGATAWLNSQPLTPDSLRGKVVLVEFWTYTCINWLRTLPYVRAWADKYREHGLVVIGAHTPEFEFE